MTPRWFRLPSLVILVAVAVLLGLQLHWLSELERTSTIARETALRNQILVIAQEVKYRYLTTAERILSLSTRWSAKAEENDEEARRELLAEFRQREDAVARFLFVIDLEVPAGQGLFLYDVASKQRLDPAPMAEARAVEMAVAPWRVLLENAAKTPTQRFVVEEKDPSQRMILRPLLGQSFELVGMVGFILDEKYLLDVVLPQAIGTALVETEHELRVSVRSQAKEWVFGDAYAADDEPPIRQNFLFVFGGWHLYLDGPDSVPEAWARANFAVNLGLTALLGVLLIAGLVALLHATSREMRLSEMKSDFVSNVSHELRTPLASIRVFGELMRLGKIKDASKVREYGEYIEAEGRRLTGLIDNILDFSRLESGGKDFSFERIDLTEVVSEQLETWRFHVEPQGFEIRSELQPSPIWIEADRESVSQALFNMLDNAIKYSGDSRQIEVRVGVDRDRGPSEAKVMVEDFGIGIARAEHERIFERFHRAERGLTHDVKGSGLGLSLVRHIASAHGGDVTVKSSPGSGSLFTLHLPLDARGPDAGPPILTSGEEAP